MTTVYCNSPNCVNRIDNICTAKEINVYEGIAGYEWCSNECLSFVKEETCGHKVITNQV